MDSKNWRTRFGVRAGLWIAAATAFGVAAAAPYAGAHRLGATALQQQGRKSTDPPVPPKGKLGQDVFLAIDHHDLPALQALLAKGADPDSRNGLEFTPLYMAAASHQTEAMQALIQAGAKPDADSTYGTPLLFSCATANLEGERLLISLGANVNTVRTDGMTALMFAANAGMPVVVADLISHKAEINVKDDSGATALSLAARGGNVAAGHILLDAGANVNTADAQGRTPLMEAAVTGREEFVSMLLKAGAKVDARDREGRTALILTTENGDQTQVVRALIRGGANVKAADSHGCTAAAFAKKRGEAQCSAILGRPSASALAAAGAVPTARQAVKASLKRVQGSMFTFTQMSNCISCHQEGLGRVATGEARSHGFQLDPAVQKVQMGRITGMLSATRPLHEMALKNPEAMRSLPLVEINEVSTADTWLLAGMAAQQQKPDANSRAMTMVLARQQMPDGCWSFSIPREPMQSSRFTYTALAVEAMKIYGPKSNAKELAARVSRAKSWLVNTKPMTGDDRASRLLGLKWSGAGASAINGEVADIRAHQRPDGGWSQLGNMQSDAYATGQALYSLHKAGGVKVTDPAYRRGVAYLLRTQDSDGTWFVNKRAIPANNYFDSGFSNGESQYASFNGTCWAILALLDTISG